MRSRNSFGWAVAALVATASCTHPARSGPPGSPPLPAPPALKTLRRDIDQALARPQLARGYWGVLVKSLKTDETLYALNAGKLMLPASNMKIVTLAAAAEKLGWDYRYETRLFIVGSVAGGMLQGDLIVAGSGDPSIVAAEGMADRIFADWADRLKASGIRAISGRVIGDDNGFEKETLGLGWMWDDLPDDYSAGVGALQYNESAVRVTVAPGPAAGDAAGISITPDGSGLTIVSAVTTTAPGGTASISTRRLPGSMKLELRGSIPSGSTPSTLTVSIDNPTQFFVSALRNALIANGIDVRGPAVDVDDVSDAPAIDRATPIVSYQSPPLSTLAVRLMKMSQNQYAETLLKTVGAAPGVIPTAAGGRSAAQAIFERWGVNPDSLIQRDGSGLSRYDFVTPEALVTILTHIDRDPRLKGPFQTSLPIAGAEGLSTRMKGTPAEGNARAKTGSMTGVRGLSGYVTAADGEPLVFSILANNFEVPAAVVNQTADSIVVRLASFRR
ncbi:MAG TPA: D-alanyl-D-alanine carboxypeptidase/D-alanyl-D-alanine-endopeptidase [Vicinamibacterales bacterium]|nr:D-alanyl-D-alanine carboxypeptidase/D-alanyl-D-alanine-endopeptidase [Vicinamibacterales bacterium]